MIFLYLSSAISMRAALNSCAPTSFLPRPNSTFSSSDMLQVSLAFSNSVSSKVRTTLSAMGNSLSPSCGSMHRAGFVQVTMARSCFFISRTANSRASQTSPLPAVNSMVLEEKLGSGMEPSVAASTRSLTLVASLGVSQPSPSFTCFFMMVLFLPKEQSLVSYISTNVKEMEPPSDLSSPYMYSFLHFSDTSSPFFMPVSALSTAFATGPKTSVPRTYSNSPLSSTVLPSEARDLNAILTSSPSLGFFHPEPSLSCDLITPSSPNRSSLDIQLSNSTSKTSAALAGIFGGEPASPYASSWEMVNLASSPFFMVATPKSQPLITWPLPSEKVNGSPLSREESNWLPSDSSVPT
mmetsp:Transcript_71380/g.220658  ORF Transcript_71380/g.220658 Transcript_71380/m.220658 type:complete len:352 (-) Transcript_71380:273-1328(-)